MGKKIMSKPSPKISKAKVVRPRVFITQTSRFKSLVQELTGNGIPHFQSLSPPPSREVNDTSSSRDVGGYHYYMEQTLLDEYDHRSELSSTSELSIDQDRSITSLSTSETTWSSLESWDQKGFLMENVDDQVLSDLLAVRDIETWLLLETDI